MNRRLAMALVVLGSVALLAGTFAGIVNRNVLDGPRFARHVDAMREDPAVANQLGLAITDRILVADPDLVAVRPLLVPTTTSLVGSDAFGPIFRHSVEDL